MTKALNVKTLNIGSDFNFDPSGRFYTDGDGSGEEFREDVLKPKLKELAKGEKLTIVLDDGIEGFGSSFLVEGFAGAVKHGYIKSSDLLSALEFEYSNPDFKFYEERIISYIKDAKYDSQKYVPSK